MATETELFRRISRPNSFRFFFFFVGLDEERSFR